MSTYKLKWIAVISMTIDHMAFMFGQQTLQMIFPNEVMGTYLAINIARSIGRLAFPIFAFLIAEGCIKTRNLPRYIVRLAVFAFLSHLPYYWAHFTFEPFGLATVQKALESIIALRIHNVLATLCLGAIAVFLYQKSLRLVKGRAAGLTLVILVAGVCFVAQYMHAEYGAFGVMLIVALYLIRESKQRAGVLLVWCTGFYLLWASWNGSRFMWTDPNSAIFYILPWLASCADAVLIALYNGKKGRSMKWFFYAYYPLHLMALDIIREILLR